ncbi:galactose oxidase [Gigaspora margarita]|uniref:Galactose oxidase n=1 Tax=Gigaspora margarita TaxID=4874 RepID=A0A8H4ARZ1_GIGMA|nr:galactose oxidase [Gigaspora margarita]
MNLIQSIFDCFLILSFVNLFVICDDFPLHKGKEMPLAVSFASSCVSPIDNSSVFLICGNMSLAYNASVPFYSLEVYIFDSKMSYWRPAKIIDYNNSFTARSFMQAVIDNDGKIFMFGGADGNSTNANITKVFMYNDMHMLDTTTMKWSTLNISQNVPLPCIAYAAALLPTDEIIYIGGCEWSLLIPPRLVDIKMQTIGASIDSRFGHTAVLTPNESIIIYGGSTMNITQVSPDLVVLNINTWEWFIPNIPQKDAPLSLIFHSAAIYENYMIVSFGAVVSQLFQQNLPAFDNIYILDLRNYTWVTVATINNLESIPVPTNPNTYTLIIVVTSLVGIILIGSVIAGIFIYKKRQELRHSIATPGSK